MTGLTLRQKLALTAWLLKHLENDIRKGLLVPEAAAEMTPGERLAAKFGGELAAWVSMPAPAVRVRSKDRLLAWCRRHLPDAIETVEQVRPATVTALIEDVKRHGGWPKDGDTEDIIPVDGIEADSLSPRVELEDCAGDVIGRAWPQIREQVGEMLALPSGGEPDAA